MKQFYKFCVAFSALLAVNFTSGCRIQPRVDTCIPSGTLSDAVAPTIAIQEASRVHGQAILDAGIVVNFDQPGAGFFSHAQLSNARVQRYNEGNDMNRYLQLLQNRVMRNTDSSTNIMNREEFLAWLDDQTGCPTANLQSICTTIPIGGCPGTLWRSIDGTCNNIRFPAQGSFDTEFSRVLPTIYDDDIFSIRKSVNGLPLPNARKIASTFVAEAQAVPANPNAVLGNSGSVLFSQAIIHDITGSKLKQTGGQSGPGTQCCAPDRSAPLPPGLSTQDHCWPITVAKDDAFYSQHNVACLNFVRSQTVNDDNCKFRPAQQTNIVTHYLDGSHIYGSTVDVANSMRSFTGGLMQLVDNILPAAENGNFFAGDHRAMQTPHLAFYHSIYYREHNRVANQFAALNPTWDDERIYQEARRVVIALVQHNTYEEFLPIFIGESAAQAHDLLCRTAGFCDCYSETVDASVINEFTTGPGRYFHFFVPNFLHLRNAANEVQASRISHFFQDSSALRTNYDDVVRGLLFQNMRTAGFPQELLNHMFRVGANEAGIDLFSADIERGRDHGLPPYNEFRKLCSLPSVNTIDELEPFLISGGVELLKSLYEHVDDIDFIIGTALERIQDDGWLGPTSQCLTIEQFKRFKCGDSFWYTSSDSRHPFTLAQLEAIKSDSFARMVCENTDLTQVPANSFAVLGPNNPLIECSSFRSFDTAEWRQAPFS